MDGIILRVKENGQIEEYKEPYTTIECATEEDYKKLEHLLNLGKATEKILEITNTAEFTKYDKYGRKERRLEFETAEEILQWFEESED